MNVGILGLGLIGGSLARAYAKNGHVVYAADANDEETLIRILDNGCRCKKEVDG